MVEDWWSVVFVSAIGALLVLVFVWKHLNKDKNGLFPSLPAMRMSEKVPHQSGVAESLCNSPTCVRCHAVETNVSALKEQLLVKCYNYAVSVFHVPAEDAHNYIATHYPRVLSTINSIESKDNILRSVYKESGYKTELSASQPHIWMMPGLRRIPFWSISNDPLLRQTIKSKLGSLKTLEIVRQEFYKICNDQRGWKLNSVPNGKWRVYSLFNQGEKMTENCLRCPQTVALVESLTNFVSCCVYGNAMFSVLEPGSCIEPHTGPCNFRLRCHLPLLVPDSGWTIKVGPEEQWWKEGEVMVFDDSYVHTVRHEDGCKTDGASPRERVLLIIDLWHPDVKLSERDILTRIFHTSS